MAVTLHIIKHTLQNTVKIPIKKPNRGWAQWLSLLQFQYFERPMGADHLRFETSLSNMKKSHLLLKVQSQSGMVVHAYNTGYSGG